MDANLIAMDLKELISKHDEKMQKAWKLFFMKIVNNKENDSVYSLDEIPEDEHEGSMIWSEMELIEIVENEMKSNLKQLILLREKAKLFGNFKDYKVIHPQALKEIRKLRKKLTKDDVQVYLEVCVIPDDEIVDIIEKNLQSNLKTILLDKTRYSNLSSEPYYKIEFIENLIREWNYLKTVVPEEEIIKYAVMLQKKYQKDLFVF